jgi:virulence-associated protein VapD
MDNQETFYEKLDSYDFGDGKTLRSLIPNQAIYNLISIGFKSLLASEIEPLTKSNAELSKENVELSAKLEQVSNDKADIANQLHQEKFDHTQTQQYRDNAVSQLEEAKKEIDRLNGHVDDLRQQINIGVQGSLKVVNSEEEEAKKTAALAELKRQFTVYDEEPLDFKRSKYRAKRATDDSEVEYTNLEKPSYTVINSTEVSQFRQQYPEPVAQEDHADPSLDQSVPTADVTPEVPFPEAPTIDNGTVGETVQVGNGLQQPHDESVGKTIEERVAELEAKVAALEGKAQNAA